MIMFTLFTVLYWAFVVQVSIHADRALVNYNEDIRQGVAPLVICSLGSALYVTALMRFIQAVYM